MSDLEASQATTQLLQQMRSMAAMAENRISTQVPVQSGAEVGKTDFAQLVKDSINKVNQTQGEASSMRTAFELGDPSVNLSEVMIAVRKSSVSFEAMKQVRNNLVSAYREVMRMPV